MGYTAFDIGPPYAPQEFTIALPEDEAEVLRDFYGWRNRWSTVTASELTLYDDEGKLLHFNSDGKIIREVK